MNLPAGLGYCGACKLFDGTTLQADQKTPFNFCRAHPPLVNPNSQNFPMVNPKTDWCGEFIASASTP